MKTLTKTLFVMLALFAAFVQTARASVGFTVTPASVSNTYTGTISLQITGLTNGETVVVQKYANADTNTVVDAYSALVQQFTLTDGKAMVIGGVTNINVPGDTDSVTGQITTKQSFQDDFSQAIVAHYLLKLSSPVGHFSPITIPFTVTNFPFGQKFTGTVLSNGVAVPYASVILFEGGGGNDLNPTGGALANSSGVYTILAPTGDYILLPFKTNFVANVSAAGNLVLTNGETLSTNLTLIPATTSISGSIVNATNSSIGVPGLFLPVQSSDGFLGICFTDTNGNFYAGVTADQWKVGGDSGSVAVVGYADPGNKTKVSTTNGSISGLTVPLTEASALFYGTVKDVFGNPLSQVVDVEAYDNNNGLYDSDGYTDANGNYTTAAVGGLGTNDQWQVDIDNSSSFTNYIFSQPEFDQNGGTNINVGQSIEVNITALFATNYITGHVQENGTAITNLNVNAYAEINGITFNASANTDNNGNYSMLVGAGTWNVGVNCQGGNQSLDGILGSGTYQCPNNTNITISGANGTANFNVQPCNGVQILTGSPLPTGVVGDSYNFQLQGSTCSGDNVIWSLNNPGSFPLSFNSNGQISGTPNTSGTITFSVNASDGNGNSTNVTFSITINPSLQITTINLPNGTVGSGYNQTLNASGGETPYTWSTGSADGLNLSTNGVLSGTPINSGAFSFPITVTDGFGDVAETNVSLTINGGSTGPLQITTTNLSDCLVGSNYNQQLAVTGGQSPYQWSLSPGSLLLPAGVLLFTNGIISGAPTATAVGTNYFSVRVTDSASNTYDHGLSITVYPSFVMATNALTNGTVGIAYSQQVLVSGGDPYYIGNSSDGYGSTFPSGSLPPGLSFSYGPATSSNEYFIISGIPNNSGPFSFVMGAYDADGNSVSHNYSITIGQSALAITTASLNKAVVGAPYSAQLQASNGTPPYTWTIANGSQPLPSGLTLSTNGLISGTPSVSGTNNFIAQVTDHNSVTVTKSLTLVSVVRPVLSSPSVVGSEFQMLLTGSSNQNYTVQVLTNLDLTNWTTILTTNVSATNSFLFTDPAATTKLRFYRVIVGP